MRISLNRGINRPRLMLSTRTYELIRNDLQDNKICTTHYAMQKPKTKFGRVIPRCIGKRISETRTFVYDGQYEDPIVNRN
jgi:hypothetical protein